MASPGERHHASCIGALSFPVARSGGTMWARCGPSLPVLYCVACERRSLSVRGVEQAVALGDHSVSQLPGPVPAQRGLPVRVSRSDGGRSARRHQLHPLRRRGNRAGVSALQLPS